MGMYKYIKRAFEKEYKERSAILRHRITEWRKLGTVTRIEREAASARPLESKRKEKDK